LGGSGSGDEEGQDHAQRNRRAAHSEPLEKSAPESVAARLGPGYRT